MEAFVITRVIKAPREKVFDVFTNPDHLAQWWGPRGFTTSTFEMDVRPGGRWRYIMHGPDGTDYDNRIVYTEVVRPERLVYVHSHDIDDDPLQFNSSITFEDVEGGTLVTLRVTASSEEQREDMISFGAVEGGTQTLARADEFLSIGDAMFTYARTFNAPLTRVWDCYTKEEHLTKWWGPKGFVFLSCKLDLRPSGSFHYGMQGPDGSMMWGMLRYREVQPYEKLVFITEFSDEEGNTTRHPLAPNWPLQTMTIATFIETDGKTTISFEVRPVDASIVELEMFASAHSGMNVGTNGMFDMLDAYLNSTMG